MTMPFDTADDKDAIDQLYGRLLSARGSRWYHLSAESTLENQRFRSAAEDVDVLQAAQFQGLEASVRLSLRTLAAALVQHGFVRPSPTGPAIKGALDFLRLEPGDAESLRMWLLSALP